MKIETREDILSYLTSLLTTEQSEEELILLTKQLKRFPNSTSLLPPILLPLLDPQSYPRKINIRAASVLYDILPHTTNTNQSINIIINDNN